MERQGISRTIQIHTVTLVQVPNFCRTCSGTIKNRHSSTVAIGFHISSQLELEPFGCRQNKCPIASFQNTFTINIKRLYIRRNSGKYSIPLRHLYGETFVSRRLLFNKFNIDPDIRIGHREGIVVTCIPCTASYRERPRFILQISLRINTAYHVTFVRCSRQINRIPRRCRRKVSSGITISAIMHIDIVRNTCIDELYSHCTRKLSRTNINYCHRLTRGHSSYQLSP